MAPLYWDRLHWPEFVAKLEGYRENYAKQGREDPAYLRCLRIMRERPMVERAVRTRDIVLFLNTWSCHLPREISVRLLSRWIRNHLEQLETLEGVRITDDDFLERLPEMLELYRSCIRNLCSSVSQETHVATRSRAATSSHLPGDAVRPLLLQL